MVQVVDYGFEVSEFELQSRYDGHFCTNTLGQGIIPLSNHGLNYTITVQLQGRLWHYTKANPTER